MRSELLEIEMDAANRDVFFKPLGRNLRGRFDMSKCKESGARDYMDRYPVPLPGMRVTLDPAAGVAAIIDPLYDVEFRAARDSVEKKHRLATERESVDVSAPNTLATWVRELGRLVQSGLARIVRGTLPTVPGEPKLHFLTKPRASQTERLAIAFERFTAEQARQTDALLSLVTSLAAKKA
jgi:hypothetical protein